MKASYYCPACGIHTENRLGCPNPECGAFLMLPLGEGEKGMKTNEELLTEDRLLTEIDAIDKELVKLGDGNLNDALNAVRRIRMLIIADRVRMIKAIEAKLRYDEWGDKTILDRDDVIAIIKGEAVKE